MLAILIGFLILENPSLVFGGSLYLHVPRQIDPYTNKKNVFYVNLERVFFFFSCQKSEKRKS